MLVKYVPHHQCDWDENLPFVIVAYQSSVHASTQYTPFYLLFGHVVQLPVNVMFGRQPNHKPEVSEYVGDLCDALEEVHEHARELLVLNCLEAKKDHYDQRIAGEKINIGLRVFLHDPAVKRRQTKKLPSPCQGPNVVMTKIGDVTYCIRARQPQEICFSVTY